eukprot:TRINITY_DN10899_c0_g1_i5.p2 TRINITY_DN10899_c0_g1~~TRINITY_DN10899_c0_g1_i5.p2  ORF type:complete len:159 (+),score=30.31 TRINITY_DN10899_c0_g1_i5:543-1019(+)
MKSVSSPSFTTDESIVVDQLMANTDYSCKFWAVNQGGQRGSNSTTFKTPNNGGKLARIFVEYDGAKWDADKVNANIGSTLCFLASLLPTNPQYIRALSGQVCGEVAKWSPPTPSPTHPTPPPFVTVPLYFLQNTMVNEDNLAYQAEQPPTASPQMVTF